MPWYTVQYTVTITRVYNLQLAAETDSKAMMKALSRLTSIRGIKYPGEVVDGRVDFTVDHADISNGRKGDDSYD